MKYFKSSNVRKLVCALVAVAALYGCAGTTERANGIEKMYVLYCGEGTAPDKSRWTPGVTENENKPITLSNSCYLIKHAKGWMLWETGYAEALLGMMPKGYPTPVLHWVWKNPKTLTQQLADIGLTPGQINIVGFSHAHPDHIGNGSLFNTATLYIQEPEYNFYIDPKGKPPGAPANWQKLRENPTVKLKGDTDVFGDGSVTILTSTGHTPGHQSLLVKLSNSGAILLTGDAVHFRDNWDTPRAPVQNFDKESSIKSIEKLRGIVAASNARVWINHDSAQTATLKMSPAYYD